MEGYEDCSYEEIAVRVDEYRHGAVTIGPLIRDSKGVWRDPNQGPYFDLMIPLGRYLVEILPKKFKDSEGARFSYSGPYLGRTYQYHSRMAADEGDRKRLVTSLDVQIKLAQRKIHFACSGVAGVVDESDTADDLDLEKRAVHFDIRCAISSESAPLVFFNFGEKERLLLILNAAA